MKSNHTFCTLWDLTLVMTLTLNFDGQIWNLPYLNQKWSDCREMESIHWILGIKCNYWVWPWPWIFKIKFLNSRISGIGGPIDIKQKGVIHDRDHDLLVTKMRCKDLPDSDQGDLRCRRSADSSSLPRRHHDILPNKSVSQSQTLMLHGYRPATPFTSK